MTTRPDHISLDEITALFVAARDGRPGGFDRLIAACWPVVEREARRHTFRSADGDDVVQEVWVRLVEHAATIRDPRAVLGWLIMVTRRTAAEVGRRHARLVPAELDDRSTGLSPEDEVLDAHQVRETTVGVRAALGRLTACDRNLLLLLIGDDTPNYREASRQLHRPVGSLGPTRRRLLDRLRSDPAVRHLRPAG
jgi:RNA polymerase sigma factor (sigma-70 family)